MTEWDGKHGELDAGTPWDLGPTPKVNLSYPHVYEDYYVELLELLHTPNTMYCLSCDFNALRARTG